MNGLTVIAASTRRPAPRPVGGVTLQLRSGTVTRTVPLTEVEPGRYVGTSSLDRPGTMKAIALIRRAGQRLSVPLSWSVGRPAPAAVPAPVATPPAPARGRSVAPFLLVALPPLVGALLLGGTRAAAARRRRRVEAIPAVPAAQRVLEGVR